MSLCEKLRSEMGVLFACGEHGNYVRVRTPYLYPDGDVIDVFLRQSAGEMITVTDLGESLRWLRLQTIATRRSAKQRQLLGDICMNHGLELFKGQLLTRLQPTESLAKAVTRLAQGCLRVADLWFTFRARSVETVTDEVADFLVEKQFPFERGESLPGRSGRIWRPDFHVRPPRRSSLVYVLATGSRAAAKPITEHVLAAWYDLSTYKVGPSALHFVSLFDDTVDVWNEEDFRLLSDLSEITRWSNQDQLSQVLEAA